MIKNRKIAIAMTPLLLMTGFVAGQQSDAPGERLKAHTKARELAIELVSSILNVQLRQLEENGLAEQPIYSTIIGSRNRIEQLTTHEMESLTEMLERIQDASDSDRVTMAAKARATARQIAVALMAERKRLRGRLRSSQTVSLLRQLIALEEEAVIATSRLDTLTVAEQQTEVEQLVQSHLDIALLFDQLIAMLEQARETVGPDRIGATEALKQTDARQTAMRIADIPKLLNTDSYSEARQNEQSVLDTLREVLRLMQQRIQLEEEARRQALEAISAAVKQQQDLRRRTETTDLADSNDRESLAEEQKRIYDRLQKLREPLSQLAQVSEQLSAAEEAAREAAERINGSDREQALERQEAVLNMLDDIARHLSAEANDPESLAEQAARLEELGTSLNEMVEQQADVKELTETDLAEAVELEAEIADALDEADDASQLSIDVESRLDEAQQAVAKASETLEDGSPRAEQSRLEAVENAEQSLLEAAAEVQSQLSDVQQAMEAANSSDAKPTADSASKSEASSGATRDTGATNTAQQAVDIEARNFENEAWFTRLPAELQSKMRAATRRPPPRGYEARLQRYFQTAD